MSGRLIRALFARATLNAVMVKELRQVVRSRFLSALFLLFLAVLLGAMGVVMAGHTLIALASPNTAVVAGRSIFQGLTGVLAFTSLVLVPMYIGVRLAAERSDNNVDLLFITALTPGSIVRGKFYAGAVMVGLIFSACGPFMAFSYLLRGVDLLAVFQTLLVVALLAIVALHAALLLGAAPLSRAFKVAGALFVVPAAAFMGPLGLVLSRSSGGSWRFGMGSTRADMLALAVAALAIAWLLHLFAAAFISPPSANRALPIRASLTVIWLLTGIAAWAWAWIESDSRNLLFAWMVPAAAVLAAACPVAVSERTRINARIAATVPRRRWLRLPAFLLYSGMAGGLLWTLVLLAATFAVGFAAAGNIHGTKDLEVFRVLACVVLYVLAYCLTAFVLRRWLFPVLVSESRTWLVAFLLTAAVTVLPLLVGVFCFDAWHKKPWEPGSLALWQIGSVFGVAEPQYRTVHLVLGGAWTLVAFAFCIPTVLRQIREFRPPPPSHPQ